MMPAAAKARARRILYAGLFHETHTFLEEHTPFSAFALHRGKEIFAMRGDGSPVDGFLEFTKAADWEVIPTIDLRAMPSGPVDHDVFEHFWQAFLAEAGPALERGVDGVFLVLHGAMATDRLDDAEGEFLARIRALPGADALPIFGVLDLHANVSRRMTRHSNGLLAYRCNPHTDARDTALRAAALLRRALDEGARPQMSHLGVPVVWFPPGTGTATAPMAPLLQAAAEIEARNNQVWAVNVCPGFSFADSGATQLTLSAIATGPHDLGPLGALAWDLRAEGVVDYPSAADLLPALSPDPRGPIILVEPADNIGAGAPGDCTGLARTLIASDLPRSLVVLNDPAAVARLQCIAVGDSLSLALGGRGSRYDPGPLELPVTLVRRTDGRFTLEDSNSHLASMLGREIDMGPSAVVRYRELTILLTSRKTPPFDLGQLRSQGIEPSEYAFIGVKAAVAHRRAYDPIAAQTFYVDTPGPCSSRPSAFFFRHLSRPLFPFDSIAQPSFEHDSSY